MGDTRLGGDAPDMARLTRTVLSRLYNNDTNTEDCGGATEPAGREQSRPSAAAYSNIRTPSGARDPDTIPLGTAREPRTPPALSRIYAII